MQQEIEHKNVHEELADAPLLWFRLKLLPFQFLKGGWFGVWCLCSSHGCSWAELGLGLCLRSPSWLLCFSEQRGSKCADTLMQVHWWWWSHSYVAWVTFFCSFFLISEMETPHWLKATNVASYVFTYLEPDLLTWVIHLHRHSHKSHFQPCLPDGVRAELLKMGTADFSYWAEGPFAVIKTTVVQAKLRFNILFFTYGFANENWIPAWLLGSLLQIPTGHTQTCINGGVRHEGTFSVSPVPVVSDDTSASPISFSWC